MQKGHPSRSQEYEFQEIAIDGVAARGVKRARLANAESTTHNRLSWRQLWLLLLLGRERGRRRRRRMILLFVDLHP
jgi:hypothetical protein